jgi:hypothetical protein
MMVWSYGLVRLKNSNLILCEVYFDDDRQPKMYAEVNMTDLRTKGAKEMAGNDIKNQLLYARIFKEEEFNDKSDR